MSAFDEAGRGSSGGRGGQRIARGKPGGGSSTGASAFDSAAFGASSSATSNGAYGGFQGADSAYAAFRDGIQNDLNKLTKLVAAVKQQVEKLGGKNDSADLRKRLDANCAKGKDLVKAVGTGLKTDYDAHIRSPDVTRGESDQRRTQLNRFMKDYKAAVDGFQDVANAAVNGMRRHAVPTKSADDDRTNDNSDRRRAKEEDTQFMAQLQRVDLTESLLHEREEAVEDILSSMAEVNETFKDLAQIVEDQGHQLDSIEVNVGDAHARTEKGIEHLEKAAGFQKKYRKWLLIMVLVLVSIAGGITAYFLIKMKQ